MAQSRKRIGGDGNARYTAYYDDVTGRRRSAGTFGSRREADRAWQRAEAETAKGRHTDSGRSRQLFARYVEDEWFPNHQIELTTRQNYRYVLDKHILPAFGGYKMIAILPADIRAWLTALKDNGVRPATVKHCLAVLSAIFTTAFNDQITTLNPCAGIRAPTVPPATRRIITPDQFAAIHAALPTDEVRLLVETDVETGLRWGELVELRVRDLDVNHGLLAVSRTVIEIPAKFHPTGERFLIKSYPKDKQPRSLGLSRHIRALLAHHVTDKAAGDLLFPAPPPAANRGERAEGADARTLALTEPNAAGHTYRHGTITAYNMALAVQTAVNSRPRKVLAWKTQPKSSTNSYGCFDRPVLQRPDEGREYTSAEFAAFCATRRMRRSLGRTGVCWDCRRRSLLRCPEKRSIPPLQLRTRARARFAVAEYIDVFYNRRRRHSRLGYRTPAQALTDHRRPQPPPLDQQDEELSKILDTAQDYDEIGAYRPAE